MTALPNLSPQLVAGECSEVTAAADGAGRSSTPPPVLPAGTKNDNTKEKK